MSFLLGGTGNANHATKYFEIRLDSPYIVFRGTESESASAHLKGSVVLCLTEPLTIKHLKLTLNGISKVSWYLPSASSVGGSRKTWKERTFFDHTWTFRDVGKGKTETLKPDNYEFPFDIVLEGSLPESVEGLHDTWVMYRFKAEIGRKYSKDMVIRKPLRIIRTLDPSNLELSHAMSVENIWPNKIEYSISTPSKAVVFGTSLRVDFRLVSLLKGLKIGMISTQVIESHDFTLDPDVVQSHANNYKHTKVVASDEYTMDEDAEAEILDEEAEGFQFHRTLELPKTLNKCLQDTDTRGIKIRHKLKFNVQLHNPDGHTSELRATLPIALFISPSIAINDNNDLVDQTPSQSRQAVEDLQHNAPPTYGEHQFDQLYSEVDPSGYRTPGAFSAPGTPGLGYHSRNTSNENLASLNAIANSGNDPHVSAAALAHRLQNLHVNGVQRHGHSPDRDAGDYFGHDHSGNRSGAHSNNPSGPHSRHSPQELSRRGSQDHGHDRIPSGLQTPMVNFHEVEDLSRVPSYTTAVQAQPRTPYSEGLPTYDLATSGPNSGSTTPGPTVPGMAHVRQQWGSRSTGNIASLLMTSTTGHHQRTNTGNNEEERRIRLLQARARG